VARRYGVTEATVRNWAKAGRISHTRLGGRFWFTQADLDEFDALCTREVTVR
jgi:excisionase family DNA binding protein